MAGIYIHIPFCKQACNYCNFFFSTSQVFKKDYLYALHQEIEMQKYYLENQKIESIYFGGGTPSILSEKEVKNIILKIKENFIVNENAEITLEGNPDDLTKEKLQSLFNIGVNRLSIGIQSFFEEDLQYMNRAHNAIEAKKCISDACAIGFKDISIDLIYGTPGLTNEKWQQNLAWANEFDINHLSSYALTVEEGTPLFHAIRKGKTEAVDENLAAEHFEILSQWAQKNNWSHYEISNLSKEANFSKHNTSYWQGKHYLGVGASAHSFNGVSRQWNIANMKKYIDGVQSNNLQFEKEILSQKDQYNEYVMTSLRTIWGIDKNVLKENFNLFYPNFEKQLQQVNPNWITENENKVVLSQEGRFYADGIAASLFCE